MANYLKAVRYLNVAAKKGNHDAICVLAASLIKEKRVYTRHVKEEIIGTLDFLIGKAGSDEKLFLAGVKAMVLQQREKAFNSFDRLMEQSSSAKLLAEAALALYSFKDSFEKSVRLMLKAIEVAGKQHIDIIANDMAVVIKDFLIDMNIQAKKDSKVADLLVVVQSALKRYNYTL